MAPVPTARFRIGPSGWSYPDWEGVVYPATRPRGFRPLRFIAQLFDAVEVNSSFYRIPEARMTAAWVPLVPADFRFAFKLTRTFTHERGQFPPQRDFDAFADGLRPVREAGLLGPLLIQFPWSFRFNDENADWLCRLADRLGDFQRFIEVRHSSWSSREALDAIGRAGGYCNIDQPQLRDCLPPTAYVFEPSGASSPMPAHVARPPPAGQSGEQPPSAAATLPSAPEDVARPPPAGESGEQPPSAAATLPSAPEDVAAPPPADSARWGAMGGGTVLRSEAVAPPARTQASRAAPGKPCHPASSAAGSPAESARGIAYVRLHGRNAGNWFADDLPPFERYNYLYSEREVREWVARIESMAASADEVYVFANNHYRGQGVANALELRAMLERRPVDIPSELVAAYPRLKSIAAAPRQRGLFD